jgi:hypothetical protein
LAKLICVIGTVASLFVATALAFAAPPDSIEVHVYALSSAQKREYAKQPEPRLNWLLQNLKPIGLRVKIDTRTEFHTLLIDKSGRKDAWVAQIRWLHNWDKRLYIEPTTQIMQKRPGYDYPMATSVLWSDPSSTGRWYEVVLGSSIMSKSEWEKSRCYGSRTIQVLDMKGKLLTEHTFEIFPAGRQVY